MACEEVFLQHLRERGFRMTPQRELILSALHDFEGLATAEEITQRVHETSASIDVSTVYRTLELLEELELVACIDSGEAQRRYELLGIHGPHLHLVCQNCGQVIGADLELAQAFSARLLAEFGFQPTLERLSIPGICPNCAP